MEGFPAKKLIPTIDNKVTGEIARRLRSIRGFSLRAVAKKMGYSAMYISQLERGERNWTDELTIKYLKSLYEGEENE